MKAIESIADEAGSFAARNILVRQREFHVLIHGEVADEIERLEDESDLAIANARTIGGIELGDFVAIDEGVTAWQEVVMLGAFKLRNGAPVMVNNQTTLSPSQTPNPQNR